MFKSKFKVNWISIFLKLGSSLFPQPIFKHKGRTKFNIRDSPLLWTNKLWRLTLPWTSDNWSLCSRVNALPKTRTCKIISEKERLSIFSKKELINKARKMVFFKIEKHSNIGKKYLKNTIIYNILVLYRIVKMMFSSWARGGRGQVFYSHQTWTKWLLHLNEQTFLSQKYIILIITITILVLLSWTEKCWFIEL